MFLLILSPVRLFCLGLQDLHSTMFLLIQPPHLLPGVPLCIYIPLCFYLYARDSTDILALALFTFHYVSTYTLNPTIITKHITNLHSTMFLLIRSNSFYLYRCRHIYIPLCFYLYDPDAILMHKTNHHLHSTMFLLIRTDLCARQIPDTTFTFHYVSTYTFGPCVDPRVVIKFTFHYVSTYTKMS